MDEVLSKLYNFFMDFVVLKETFPHENRVALTPDVAKKIIQKGHQVFIEKNCGVASNFFDKAYEEVGCKILDKLKALKKADVVLCVSPFSEENLSCLKKKSVIIGALKPYKDSEKFEEWSKQGITSFSLELLPRITRAQSMDILSSQSNLAGYKAVIESVSLLKRAVPLMMTAAGTVAAAKILVLGAGVAGLQAIATARRLGGIVSAFDVRLAAKEQVESLGAKFIQVDIEESGDSVGGYAKEMSEAYKQAQAEKLAETVKNQDIVITTAQIPGKQAPVLITEDMVQSMKPGSVVMDLSTETGGNCSLSSYGETNIKHGITISGPANIASELSQDASYLYARNLFSFINYLLDDETKKIKIDFEDEIIKNTLITYEENIVHSTFKQKD